MRVIHPQIELEVTRYIGVPVTCRIGYKLLFCGLSGPLFWTMSVPVKVDYLSNVRFTRTLSVNGLYYFFTNPIASVFKTLQAILSCVCFSLPRMQMAVPKPNPNSSGSVRGVFVFGFGCFEHLICGFGGKVSPSGRALVTVHPAGLRWAIFSNLSPYFVNSFVRGSYNVRFFIGYSLKLQFKLFSGILHFLRLEKAFFMYAR